MTRSSAFWIEALGLRPHPEGGWYRETYRSSETVAGEHLPPRFGGARCFSTAIYFLLPGGEFSALHRIKSDEIWHFYAGSPLTLVAIDAAGTLTETVLGRRPERGESFQARVPAGSWYGAWIEDPTSYALVGGTVAPGFDFADFELAERAALEALHPQHRALIRRLTREPGR